MVTVNGYRPRPTCMQGHMTPRVAMIRRLRRCSMGHERHNHSSFDGQQYEIVPCSNCAPRGTGFSPN